MQSTFGKGAWLKVILREGRKRQIREMGSATGLPVVRIIRTRIGALELGGLKPGDWRPLKPDEVAKLKQKPVKARREPAKNLPRRTTGTEQKPRPPAKRPSQPGKTSRIKSGGYSPDRKRRSG
jgi:23S rRNA pseudouridine2605 synthase